MLAACNVNSSSSIECVKLLIDSGSNVNQKNEFRWTSLILTSMYANDQIGIECVNLLIKSGANVNEKDSWLFSSLMYASGYAGSSSNIECVRLLIDYGADVNEKSYYGRTSLMMLFNNKIEFKTSDIDTIMLLVHKSGQTICDKDNDGNTAWCYYGKNDHDILSDDQLEYLNGARRFSNTKSAIKIF